MKTLVVIIGGQAVGKMTVGQELAKLTGLKLFYNHMSIELVRQFFSVHESEVGRNLDTLIREEIIKAVASSTLSGLILTYCMDFNGTDDRDYIQGMSNLFADLVRMTEKNHLWEFTLRHLSRFDRFCVVKNCVAF